MKLKTTFLFCALALFATAQNVTFTDTIFRNALINHSPTIDTDGNGDISTTEAQNYTGTINVSNKSISDLTGIEEFTSATRLYCFDNSLTSLDVSQNTALTRLYCFNNSLTSLDVSQNTALDRLLCHNNNLTNLDVSQNTALTRLLCHNNNLTSLDVSQNIALIYFNCSYNSLNSLDISQNSVLNQLRCFNNSLISLNVANGNNTNMSTMFAHFNPNLTCIQHDAGFDPTTTGTWYADTTASWSEDCGCMITSSTDVQEHYCSDFTWIDGITYTQDTTGVQDTLINVAGCDSIVTLNLTILQSISTYDIQEHCESFTWIDGNTYTQDTTGVQDTLVNAAGCDSIVTLNLTINTPPTVSISESNGTLIFSGTDSIEWYFNGALIPSENGDSLVLENLGENNGDYYAVGYSTSNCADTSNTISMVGLNVIENSWSNFTMYPNPTTGTVEIQSNSTVEKIEIINNLGQKVGEFKQSQFDISELKNGIYFVKVTTEIGTTTKRLIKQ